MLVLTRCEMETITIPIPPDLPAGTTIRITFLGIKKRQAMFGFEAPLEVKIWRSELLPLAEEKGV